MKMIKKKLDSSCIEYSRNDINSKIVLPGFLTTDLAEFIGIMMGDGNLGVYQGRSENGRKYVGYMIRISGNIKEIRYMEHIMDLFKRLFNVNLYLRKDHGKNAILLRKQSKAITHFLNMVCQIPVNKKSHIIKIPEVIFNSDISYGLAFLRGLVDTDFSLSFKNKNNRGHTYPVLKGSFKSKAIIEDIEKLLKNFGFYYYAGYNEKRFDKRWGHYEMHSIYFSGKKNLYHWINNIGFSNSKYHKRIQKWEKDGFCPPSY